MSSINTHRPQLWPSGIDGRTTKSVLQLAACALFSFAACWWVGLANLKSPTIGGPTFFKLPPQPQLPTLIPPGDVPAIKAHVNFSRVAELVNIVDPTIVHFQGYFFCGFDGLASNTAGYASSKDGISWRSTVNAFKGWSWISLFVAGNKLYMIGTENVLWDQAKRGKTNDLKIAELEVALSEIGVPELIMVRWEKLTNNMAVHILNNVPLVTETDVLFPFMVAPTSSAWHPVAVTGYFTPDNALGYHSVVIPSSGILTLSASQLDTSLVGIYATRLDDLGLGSFMKLMDGNSSIYGRITYRSSSSIIFRPERWNITCPENSGWACTNVYSTISNDLTVNFSTKATVVPSSPVFQEFLLTYISSTKLTQDLVNASNWIYGGYVGNPVVTDPKAHRLWAGQQIQTRTYEGHLDQCSPVGKAECIYWQEPVAFSGKDGSALIAVRFTTDTSCNSALLCSMTHEAMHSGSAPKCNNVIQLPGFGNVRGYVFYDKMSSVYWAVNNYNTDVLRTSSSKTFFREGQHCLNERGNMALFLSVDGSHWNLVKPLFHSNSNTIHIMYVSCVPKSADLLCVARTNGVNTKQTLSDPSGNNHSSKMVVAFRIENFRQFAEQYLKSP